MRHFIVSFTICGQKVDPLKISTVRSDKKQKKQKKDKNYTIERTYVKKSKVKKVKSKRTVHSKSVSVAGSDPILSPFWVSDAHALQIIITKIS